MNCVCRNLLPPLHTSDTPSAVRCEQDVLPLCVPAILDGEGGPLPCMLRRTVLRGGTSQPVTFSSFANHRTQRSPDCKRSSVELCGRLYVAPCMQFLMSSKQFRILTNNAAAARNVPQVPLTTHAEAPTQNDNQYEAPSPTLSTPTPASHATEEGAESPDVFEM